MVGRGGGNQSEAVDCCDGRFVISTAMHSRHYVPWMHENDVRAGTTGSEKVVNSPSRIPLSPSRPLRPVFRFFRDQ